MSDETPPKKDEDGGAPAWIMTFADLMSLLMCFFVLLLSFSNMDLKKFKQIAGSMKNAFGYVSHGGTYVLLSIVKGDINFNDPEFHKRETTLLSSRNATREDLEHVIEAMRAGKIETESFITHRVHFDDMIDTFESWLDPATGVIKAVVEM